MTTADELERREVSIHEWVRRASGKCCANESKYRDLCREAIATIRQLEAKLNQRDAVLEEAAKVCDTPPCETATMGEVYDSERWVARRECSDAIRQLEARIAAPTDTQPHSGRNEGA